MPLGFCDQMCGDRLVLYVLCSSRLKIFLPARSIDDTNFQTSYLSYPFITPSLLCPLDIWYLASRYRPARHKCQKSSQMGSVVGRPRPGNDPKQAPANNSMQVQPHQDNPQFISGLRQRKRWASSIQFLLPLDLSLLPRPKSWRKPSIRNPPPSSESVSSPLGPPWSPMAPSPTYLLTYPALPCQYAPHTLTSRVQCAKPRN